MSLYTDNVIKEILLGFHELQISNILKLNYMKNLNIHRKIKFSLKLTYYFINSSWQNLASFVLKETC